MNTIAGYRALLIQNSFWLFTGRAMPVIVLFLITILYSRRLSYEDYGRFQSVWMYTNLLNVIISFGITSLLLSSNLLVLAAFVNKYLSKIISAYLLLWIAVMSLFFLSVKNFNNVTKFFLISFVIIQSTCTVWETLLIKFHKEKIVFIVNFIYSLFFLGWHYYILTHQYNLQDLIEGIIVMSIAKFMIMLVIKQRQKQELVPEQLNDKLYFKHWIYLGLNDVTGVLSRWVDKLLLVYLLTPTDFALFFNGSFEIPLFGLLVSVIGSVMLIEISKNISTKEKVVQLFTESSRLLSVIVFPLFFFLLFFRTELFEVVFKNKYDASISIFIISIFVLPIRINNYSSILQYYQKGNKIMYGSLLDICLAVILMLSLYPLFGTRGVALAVVIATYCQVFYYLWQSAKVLHTGILSLFPIKTLSVTFVIMLLLFTGLYFMIERFSDSIKLFGGMIFTIIIILTGLYLYFKKQPNTTYVLTTKT
ncbi:MAG: oligosaccharide flippase family protein [Ginsengibacter sp.]